MEVERSELNGRKIPPEVSTQLPDEKMAAETGAVSGPLVSPPGPGGNLRRKADVTQVIIRLMCVLTSVTAVSVMASAKESGTISIYGFSLPISSNWSFSHSFKYLVVVSAVVTVYSVLQLLVTASRLLRKSPFIPSRNHEWLIFAGDQLFAYAMMSAGSAASGATNLNRTGIKHSPLPNFCKPLHGFCDRVAASIAFTFFTCLLLAASAVLDVILLSNVLLN